MDISIKKTKPKTKVERMKEEMQECSVVLRRTRSSGSLSTIKTLNLSESDSDMSCVTVSSIAMDGGRRERSAEKRRRSELGDESEDDVPSPKSTPARRGRGRPPTTGQYVGLAKAKADFNSELRKQLRLEAEQELDEELRPLRQEVTAFLERTGEDPENCDITEIGKMLENSTTMVAGVVSKSSNLKGTSVRSLKEAAQIVKTCAAALRTRTMTEEVRLLNDRNAQLTAELNVLRREMGELRSKLQPVQPPSQSLASEEAIRSIMVQVGTMMNARLAGLEERLLPERRVRPPLAADLRRKSMPRSVEIEPDPLPITRAPMAKEVPPKKGKSVAVATKPAEARQPVLEEAWTLVERKGSRRSKQKRSDPAAQTAPKPALPARPQPAKKKAKRKSRRLRPPRTAAVTITLQPEAKEKGVTYAGVLAEAKARIDLQALGMSSGIKMRTAATGAKIIEVPGANKAEMADSLATKLREVFQESEEVKISRPVTMADLRVTGLDESVDTTELTEAVAKAGGCSPEAIKTGLIRRGAAGMGTCVVRCPVAAAGQIMTRGRILVGWVSAQVRLLDARPRRCFRCLVLGHVRVQCKSEVDRSDECYRCGQNGHKASGCSAAPHCTLCAAVGKTADHLSGGKACAKPPVKKAGGVRAATEAGAKSQLSRPHREQLESMEES